VLQDPAPTKVFPQDSSSSATILDYQARRILIEVNTSDPTLLVLSEVFYPAGWRALVDGTETPILRTNSILRSIMVPAGKHSVVFSFDPPMYEMGWQLTQIAWTLSSVLVLVPLTVYAVQAIRKRRQPPSPSDNGRQDVNSNS
ncbi:MAG: YfhO family protein, partial [Bacteroidota bacterium]